MDKSIVYRITFADGAIYIGKTSMSLNKRLIAHRNAASNPGIAERMKRKIKYTIDILFESCDAQQVREFEIDAIRAEAEQSNMLNVTGTPKYCKTRTIDADIDRDGTRGRKRTDYPQPGKDRPVYKPTVDSASCSVCGERKPAGQFHRDRCRANGLGSRCKLCKNALNKIQKSVKSRDPSIRDQLMPNFQLLVKRDETAETAMQKTIEKFA